MEQVKIEVKKETIGIVNEFYEKAGAQTIENLKNNRDPKTINLTNKISGRITKDFGSFKKGHEQEFSEVAYAIYEAKKVIEKI